MPKSKVFMVAGLGFGDEGKGTITEYLTAKEKAKLNVRYNGGAQAAHNVVLSNGRHHTFSQFGSGTFQGAATHLSRFMIVDPMALMSEARALQGLGVSDILDRLTIEQGAPLITPYHKASNRLREALRGRDKHGSCGIGVGETVADHAKYGSALLPTAGDLDLGRAGLEQKLAFVQELKIKEFGEEAHIDPLMCVSVSYVADLWLEAAKRIRIVDGQFLLDTLPRDGTIIFEGAQGVLLDRTYGFFPHSTPTNITFDNAYALLDDLDLNKFDICKVGVIRTYHTRHGAGPLPTEILDANQAAGLEEKHNRKDVWQGGFRVGFFDLPLFRYALDVIGPLDIMAITHIDYLPKLGLMCDEYKHDGTLSKYIQNGRPRKASIEDLSYQERLGRAIASPALAKSYCSSNDKLVAAIFSASRARKGLLSRGPSLEDKELI